VARRADRMRTFVLTEDELHVLEVVYGQTVRV
jgi:hypothetical protein